MVNYVLTSRRVDFDEIARRAEADESPAHLLRELARRLDAQILQPGDAPVGRLDRVLARIVGTPEQWAIARQTLRNASRGDFVFCNGEDIGLAVGLLNAGPRRGRVRLAFAVMAPERTRARWLLRLLHVVRAEPLLLTGVRRKADFLRTWVKADPKNVAYVAEQVDDQFFRTTDEPKTARPRPLIVSCGLEQRDYQTLIDAIAEQDVDVKICAVSPNYTQNTRVRMPQVVPDNVEMRHFEFPELRELYQQADVTVVPLLDNEYSAGITAMLEAMACGSPVVITRTPGLIEELADDGFVWAVPPNDPEAMWKTVDEVLSDPDRTKERTGAAVEHFHANFGTQPYLERVLDVLERVISPERRVNRTLPEGGSAEEAAPPTMSTP